MSPLNYISPVERGGNPEETVSNTFKIDIDNCDDRFEYIRIYSIHRTSLDAVPTVKRVTDIDVQDKVSYTDTGTVGDVIDPSQLLYIGGEEIYAGTICHKDGTLFIGNIKTVREPLLGEEIKQ